MVCDDSLYNPLTGLRNHHMSYVTPTGRGLTPESIDDIAHKIALEYPNDYLLPSDRGLNDDTSKISDIPGMILDNLTYGHSYLDSSMNNAGYDWVVCNHTGRLVYKKHDYKLSPESQTNTYKDYYDSSRCGCGNCSFLTELNVTQAQLLKPFKKDTSTTLNEFSELQKRYPNLNKIPFKSRNQQILLDSILSIGKSKTNFEVIYSPRERKFLFNFDENINKTFRKIPDILKLPGKGKGSDICGNPLWYKCPDCNEYHTRRHQCKKRECPDCCDSWKFHTARKVSNRLWYGREELCKQGYSRGRIAHCVVSFDMSKLPMVDEITLEDLFQLEQIALNNAESHGITGGTIICHMFRDSDKKGVYDVPGIHFHIIGYAPNEIIPGNQYWDEGLIFKNIRTLNNLTQIRKTTAYQLGHCLIMDTKHSVKYFGDFSYNNLNKKSLLKNYPQVFGNPKLICPNCGSDEVFFVGFNAYPDYKSYRYEDYYPYDT